MQSMRLLILICLCLFLQNLSAQDSTLQSIVPQVHSKYFETVSKKAENLNEAVDKKSEKVLSRMKKAEMRLRNKLAKIDSLASDNIFSDAESKYKQLEERLKSSKALSQYIPRLDTVITSFKFLEQNPQWLDEAKDAKEKLSNAISKVKELERQLQKAEDIKQFLKERRQYLKEQLQKFGFTKELKKLNKTVYYYSQQLQEYKAILKDPKKIERKAIDLLTKTKLFKDFMRKNSVLASLFRMPDSNDPLNQANLSGLQTRAQINALIQNQVAAGGSNARQMFQQNLQQGTSQLQELKNKINNWGGGTSGDLVEGFKPNHQKVKSFWKRLEYGSNIQTQGARYFYPVTSDLGLSVGYRLNDKSVLGLGASYKIGWGSGWNNIRITHQGIGLRSYADVKLKGSFWISGGYEQNYRSEIRTIDQLSDRSAWQQSGLIGISKVISVKSKTFKKTKAQLSWDFMSYRQIPRTQPIVFRLNYSFN